MSIHYLLDGYNIIHSAAMQKHRLTARKLFSAQQRRNDDHREEFSCKMPVLSQAKLEDQRNRLIRFIETFTPQGSSNNRVTVVFDGNTEVFGGMTSSSAKVIFSQGESADERIKQIVAQAENAKNIIVVSDDRDIQYAVRALGAKTSSVKGFLSKIKLPKKGSPESGKYISKTDETRITSELEKIWLKPDEG